MSYNQSKYDLTSGPYGLCSGIFDKDTQTYKKSNQQETEDCCLNTCSPLIKECLSYCDMKDIDKKRCNRICNDIKKTCRWNCHLTHDIQGLDTSIAKYAGERFSCDNNDFKCMQNNREELINYCLKECIPSEQVDCNQYCDYIVDQISGVEKQFEYYKYINKHAIPHKIDYWLILLICIGIFMIIIIYFKSI